MAELKPFTLHCGLPHCPNKNVFSNRLNWPYDSSHSLRLGSRLFQTCGPAAAKVLSRKLLRVRLTISVPSVDQFT